MRCVVQTSGIHIALLVMFITPCTAHEGGHGEVTDTQHLWQLTSGTSIQGSYVSATATELRVLTADGTITQVPIDQLDDPSRQMLERQIRRIESLNRPSAVRLVAQVGAAPASVQSVARPSLADSFKAFEKSVSLRWDHH